MHSLPNALYGTFIGTTLLGVWLFYRAANRSGHVLGVLSFWLFGQSFIALSGFYTVADSRPPRLLPSLLVIAGLFGTAAAF